MNHHPLLLFPAPGKASPAKRNGGGSPPNTPSISRQAEILGPKFSRLEDAIENRRIEVQNDTPGIDPEYTVIIETYGSVSDFFKAVRKISGLEWLGEYEIRELEPNEDFYARGSDPQKPLNGQVMLMLSDRRAINELLSLWRQFGQDPSMEFTRGWAKFRDLFRLLKDIRYWDTQDRLNNTGILEYWRERLEHEPDSPVRFEAELWFRTIESKRELALRNVTDLTLMLGGQVLSSCDIPEINYQSLLIELPANQVNSILNDSNVALVRCDQVMLFRPLGQMSVDPLWNDAEEDSNYLATEIVSDQETTQQTLSPPRVALLDGLPLANHKDIQDYLIIDDPDSFETDYLAEKRIHGTAMASLIINGDLNEGARKITSSLYVRPIMKPNIHTSNQIECIPDTELPIDMVHRAVKRIFNNDGDEPPAAPSVKVINLSIGDPNNHFNEKISPFARLLDWLSVKYNVLFIVSAGNHAKAVTVPQPGRTFHELPHQLQALTFFTSLQNDHWDRRLLSPAESVNALTVGALHSDKSSLNLRDGLYNLYDKDMPAAYSAQGNGYLRSIKPDIVMPGGRILHNEPIIGSDITSVNNYAPPGQLVAHPRSSELNFRVHSRGTSNSAALASRSCAEICEILETLFIESGKPEQFEQYSPLLLKTLVTHGASWNHVYDHINDYLNPIDATALKKIVSRNIGYGNPDIDRAKFCLDNRATVLGYGSIEDDEAHIYKIPIPEGLGGSNVWRRLTVSLSWFATPCPTNLKYRDGVLWFTLEGDNKELTRRSPKSADWMQVKRGTLQHEIFEGEDLAVLSDDKNLVIKVSCKKNASKIINPINYGLAITLEVAEGTSINLYQDIQESIEEQVRLESREQIPAR
ncbi:MAG: S8 family peptidase [Methyloprofundus sp.]|nr:S8 family peptidase [Methyloprofundus sp.]